MRGWPTIFHHPHTIATPREQQDAKSMLTRRVPRREKTWPNDAEAAFDSREAHCRLFHRELGKIMWDYCGMSRNESGLKLALEKIPELRAEFWRDVNVPGSGVELNQSLERAGRVADFLELGELMCIDALHRTESCGGHFREESQTPDGEALRDDANFAYVAAWNTPLTQEADPTGATLFGT